MALRARISWDCANLVPRVSLLPVPCDGKKRDPGNEVGTVQCDRSHGAIVAKSCHLLHVFSGYENQTNIARKWTRIVGERIGGKPELRLHTCMVPRALGAPGIINGHEILHEIGYICH